MLCKFDFKPIWAVAVVLAATLMQGHLVHAAEPYPWKAGAASIVITPEKPLRLADSFNGFHLSFGIVQDIRADALVLEDAKGTKMVFLTCDANKMPPEIRSYVEKQLAEKYRIPPESLLINVSSIHTAPILDAMVFKYYREISESQRRDGLAYIDQFRQKLIKVVDQAFQNREPARIDYSVGKADFAMRCRRLNQKEKRTFWPEGPTEHDVPVLRVSDRSGKKLLAVLFGYACQGRTFEGSMIYGGVAGFARDFLREKHPKSVFLFLNGCGGDQYPYTEKDTFDEFRKLGRELAQVVEECTRKASRPVKGPLALVLEPVSLSCEKALPRRTLINWEKEQRGSRRARAKALLDQLQQHGKISTECSVPIQVVQFDHDLLMIALPSEPMADYSLRFKETFGSKIPTWVAGFCNVSVGRLPTLNAQQGEEGEGGDDGDSAIKNFSLVLSGPFDETVEQRIVQKVHELVKKTAVRAGESSPD